MSSASLSSSGSSSDSREVIPSWTWLAKALATSLCWAVFGRRASASLMGRNSSLLACNGNVSTVKNGVKNSVKNGSKNGSIGRIVSARASSSIDSHSLPSPTVENHCEARCACPGKSILATKEASETTWPLMTESISTAMSTAFGTFGRWKRRALGSLGSYSRDLLSSAPGGHVSMAFAGGVPLIRRTFITVASSPSTSPSITKSVSPNTPLAHHNVPNPIQPFSTQQPPKISSQRAQNAIQLLPSYLIDARAITKYSKQTPHGALQLSVAENQLSELPLQGITPDGQNGQNRQHHDNKTTLMDILSSLASSTNPPPSQRSNDTNDTNDANNTAVRVFGNDMIYYQPTQGMEGTRHAMAAYLQTLLVSPITTTTTATTVNESESSPSVPKMHPDGIVLGAGCNAVLENLCLCLTEPGEAVMIPTPYYAAFEFDLVARAGCRIVPVNTFQYHPETPPQFTSESSAESNLPIPASSYYPNRLSLDYAYQRAIEETSSPPRVLLLSHPNNPLGVCYPPHVLQECIDWCRERQVHLISDEIYAGSVYRKHDNNGNPTFVSTMALASNHQPPISTGTTPTDSGLGLGPYIHLVYALSKDFALSGLRVGVAYTENPDILLPLQKLNDLCQISSQTQLLVERMLRANVVDVVATNETKRSKLFVEAFLEANQSNIQSRCDRLQQCLDDLRIPYLPADSGLFVWMDFREFLPPLQMSQQQDQVAESLQSKEQRERELYLSLMKEYGLLFTPGMSMRNERAGFFRCVFTAASEEEFDLGLVRIRKFVEAKRGVGI